MELKTRNAARQALVPPKLEDVSPNVDTMETLPMDMDYKTPSPVVTKTNLFTPDKVDQIKKGLGDSFDTSMAKDPYEVQPIVTTGSNENSPDCLQDPYQMAEVSAAASKPGTAGDVPAGPSLRRGDGLDSNHEDGEHGGLHPEVAGEPEATLENLGDEIPPLPADTNHEDGEHGGLHPEVAGEPEATLENLGDEIPPLPADTNHEDGEHGGLHPEVAGEPEATLENLGDEIPPLPADTNHEDGEHGGLHPEVAGEPEATLENLGDEIPPLPLIPTMKMVHMVVYILKSPGNLKLLWKILVMRFHPYLLIPTMRMVNTVVYMRGLVGTWKLFRAKVMHPWMILLKSRGNLKLLWKILMMSFYLHLLIPTMKMVNMVV